MILSHRHRFVFIKGLKVGGTSIEIALSGICGPEDIITTITPIDERLRASSGRGAQNYSRSPAMETSWLQTVRTTPRQNMVQLERPKGDYFQHMSLMDVLARQGAAVAGYRVACVERNPYAKVISWAYHGLNFRAYRSGGEMGADPETLRAYLDRVVAEGSIVAVRNIDRYRGPNGLVTAEVLCHERLAEEFRAFVDSLGVAVEVPLPHAKKGIEASALDALDMLTRSQIKQINELFADEFATFGYKPL